MTNDPWRSLARTSWAGFNLGLSLSNGMVDFGEKVRSPESQQHEGEHADGTPGEAPSTLREAPAADQQRQAGQPDEEPREFTMLAVLAIAVLWSIRQTIVYG